MKARAILIGSCILAIVTLGISCKGCSEEQWTPAAPGTPVTVSASAAYVDDQGKFIFNRYGDILGVAGVEIAVTDDKGNSLSATTRASSSTGRRIPIEFVMLAEHDYTISATFKDSNGSTQATIKGYVHGDTLGSIDGGSITVKVWKSSNTIRSVSYSEPSLVFE